MLQSANPEYLWLDGEMVPWENATVHVTHGHIFAHSVFEGIRAYWNADRERLYVFRLDAHLERLFRSIKLLRMTTRFTFDQLKQAAVDVCKANGYKEDIYLFPLAYFDPGVGLSHMTGPAHIYINTFPNASKLDRPSGIKCCVSAWTRITDNMLPARIKCWANYRNSAMAWTDATLSGFDGAIMLNARGKVCEAPGACLVMIREGVVITPPVTSDILESVTRAALLQMCREALELQVVEREVDRTELYTADEIFLCGTGAEVTPVASIDHYDICDGGIGPVTQRLRTLYNQVIRGMETRYEAWRTPVE